MNETKEILFNKIYVIESLFPDDKKTGTLLYNDLLKIKTFQIPQLKSELFNPNTKKELIECFEKIKKEIVELDTYPFIHLELHGSNNKDGLALNSYELITWNELAEYFRAINQLCYHNLFVSLATCYGAYIFEEIKPWEPAPFWGYVGTYIKVHEDDIEVSFYSFFDTLLDTLDFNISVKSLNESNNILEYRYVFYNAEAVFELICETYERISSEPDNIKRRAIELTKITAEKLGVTDPEIIKQEEIKMENLIINSKEYYYQKHKSIFLNLNK
jgi:hypothetical protein